jgi:hypothetical protein
MSILIGTPVYREGAYVLDKFLANQKQIQNVYPSCKLLLATAENDFIGELKELLIFWKIKGAVIPYQVQKPAYAKNRIWNITCSREEIRRYALADDDVHGLLFLDADMTYDPAVVRIMEKEIGGYDVVFSGCPLRNRGVGLAGFGCVLLARHILEKINFRCIEFTSGEVITEGNMLEVDLFSLKARVKQGFFCSSDHYSSATKVNHISPRSVGILLKISNNRLLRYGLITASIKLHYNIPQKMKIWLKKA